MRTHTHAYTHAHTGAHTHAHERIHAHTRIHTHTGAYRRTYAHARAHMRTCTPALPCRPNTRSAYAWAGGDDNFPNLDKNDISEIFRKLADDVPASRPRAHARRVHFRSSMYTCVHITFDGLSMYTCVHSQHHSTSMSTCIHVYI